MGFVSNFCQQKVLFAICNTVGTVHVAQLARYSGYTEYNVCGTVDVWLGYSVYQIQDSPQYIGYYLRMHQDVTMCLIITWLLLSKPDRKTAVLHVWIILGSCISGSLFLSSFVGFKFHVATTAAQHPSAIEFGNTLPIYVVDCITIESNLVWHTNDQMNRLNFIMYSHWLHKSCGGRSSFSFW